MVDEDEEDNSDSDSDVDEMEYGLVNKNLFGNKDGDEGGDRGGDGDGDEGGDEGGDGDGDDDGDGDEILSVSSSSSESDFGEWAAQCKTTLQKVKKRKAVVQPAKKSMKKSSRVIME